MKKTQYKVSRPKELETSKDDLTRAVRKSNSKGKKRTLFTLFCIAGALFYLAFFGGVKLTEYIDANYQSSFEFPEEASIETESKYNATISYKEYGPITIQRYFLARDASLQDLVDQKYSEYSAFEDQKYNDDTKTISKDGMVVDLFSDNREVVAIEYDYAKSEHAKYIVESFKFAPEEEATVDYTGDDYKNLLERLVYSNIATAKDAEITGDGKADEYIRQKALERGYAVRGVANNIDTLGYYEDYPLQASAGEAFLDMQKALKNDDAPIVLLSGFRSTKTQAELFISRLGQFTAQQIIDGKADKAIEEVLSTTAAPGMSKHHSGFTVDITSPGYVLETFDKSPAFEWLSKDDYANAKKYGFIPSYPEEVENQGPNPEAWEYVYVGQEVLK